MNKNKLRVLMKAFIESQFGYCPLIWMFQSRKLNNKINRLHKRALRLVYKNSTLSFNVLLWIICLQYIKEIYNSWQPKCIKSLMI